MSPAGLCSSHSCSSYQPPDRNDAQSQNSLANVVRKRLETPRHTLHRVCGPPECSGKMDKMHAVDESVRDRCGGRKV